MAKTKTVAVRSKGRAKPAPVETEEIAENKDEVPSAYVNHIQVLTAGLIDVRLGFNEIIVDNGSPMRLLRRANIVVSTTTFLNLVSLLNGVAKRIHENSTNGSERP